MRACKRDSTNGGGSQQENEFGECLPRARVRGVRWKFELGAATERHSEVTGGVIQGEGCVGLELSAVRKDRLVRAEQDGG